MNIYKKGYCSCCYYLVSLSHLKLALRDNREVVDGTENGDNTGR